MYLWCIEHNTFTKQQFLIVNFFKFYCFIDVVGNYVDFCIVDKYDITLKNVLKISLKKRDILIRFAACALVLKGLLIKT